MSTSVVVLGTGGMGREAASWIADSGDRVVGFLDEDPACHGEQIGGHPVLGGVSWLDTNGDIEVAVAVGQPAPRAALIERVRRMGATLATVIHPSSSIGPRVTFEPGVIVCPGVVLTCDVWVGRGAIINYGAMIGHDGVVGECTFVAPGAHLAGNVTVGAQADIGIGASVIQGITIGAKSVVGAGAVVIRDVEPGTTVVGVPARPLERG